MKPIIAWAVFLVTTTGALVVARAVFDPGQRNFQYMGDMVRSVPYDTFSPNPVTRDGKTLQAPVPGTVPRTTRPFRYGNTPDEALRAGRELSNPVPLSAETLARGRALFETFCLVCHGPQGRGDGPLVPRIPNPPDYTAERVREMKPGQIYHVISRGSGRMPSYGAQISTFDRWMIVHYVDTLRAGGRQP